MFEVSSTNQSMKIEQTKEAATIPTPGMEELQSNESFNENGKRLLGEGGMELDPSAMATEGEAGAVPGQRGKRRFHKRMKTVKPPKVAMYRDGVLPVQILNEMLPGLTFTFDVDTTTPNKVKYVSHVTVKRGEEEPRSFSAPGKSKKEAKRKCCHQVLLDMYGDTYIPPQHVLDEYNRDDSDAPGVGLSADTNQSIVEKEQAEIKKRIVKLCTKSTIQFKSPTQLLHEISKKIAETGKCIGENGAVPEQKYSFQFSNPYADGEFVAESPNNVAYGFGKSKKDAKNMAAKQALKQFLDCDLDNFVASVLASDHMNTAS